MQSESDALSETDIDPLESSLLLGLSLLSFGHAGITVKVSILRKFLDYGKSTYDGMIFSALQSLKQKNLIEVVKRRSRKGAENITSITLTKQGSALIEQILYSSRPTNLKDLTGLSLF